MTILLVVAAALSLVVNVALLRPGRRPLPSPAGLRPGDRVVCRRYARRRGISPAIWRMTEDGRWTPESRFDHTHRHYTANTRPVPWEYLLDDYRRGITVCARPFEQPAHPADVVEEADAYRSRLAVVGSFSPAERAAARTSNRPRHCSWIPTPGGGWTNLAPVTSTSCLHAPTAPCPRTATAPTSEELR